MAVEIELPKLRIRVPADPPTGYWEEDPFTDDEEDEENVFDSLDELNEFLGEIPDIKGYFEDNALYLVGELEDVDAMKRHPLYPKFVNTIRDIFPEVWYVVPEIIGNN